MDYQTFSELYTSTLNLLLSLEPRYFQNRYKDQSISLEFFGFLENNPGIKQAIISLLQETKQYLENGIQGTRDESIVLSRTRGILTKLDSFRSLLILNSHILNLWEDGLWALENFKYGINLDSGVGLGPLMVNDLVLSEPCYLGCDFCSTNATSIGEMMPVGLIYELRESDLIIFANSLHLGEGEVLLYPNMEIFNVLKRMIDSPQNPRNITLTTAGLIIPENRVYGERFLRSLERFGTHCTVFVSFNLLNPAARRNLDQYLKDIRRTFEILKQIGVNVFVHLMYDGERDGPQHSLTFEKFNSINRFFAFPHNPRRVVPSGRARRNYPWRPVTPEIDCPLRYTGRRFQNFTILPNGDVGMGCSNPGGLGSIFGNVYENDAMQIRAARNAFIAQFNPSEEDLALFDKCDLHRRCKVRFKPPRSKKPVISKRWKSKKAKIAV